MNKQIFFSYAWADSAVAMRIYNDLIRSNLSVWRDQINGCPNVDFQEEFLKKIKECDIFMLLDSKNYRIHSKWCSMEIEYFFECQKTNPNKELIVCLIDENGEWRQDTEKQDLFHKVNNKKYFDFFQKGLYDNEKVYNKSINDICKFLGASYTSWNVLPYEKDFEEELAQYKNKIDDIDRDTLLKDYEIIRQRWLQRAQNIESRIENLIADCEMLQVNAIFPYLILGIIQSSNLENIEWVANGAKCTNNNEIDKNRWKKCNETYLEITKRFPNDPRGYRGLAATEFYLDNIAHALSLYEKTLLLIDKKEKFKHSESLPDILQNQGLIYLILNNYTMALEKYKDAFDIMKSKNVLNSEIFLKLELCCQFFKKDKERISIINEGIGLFFNDAELRIREGNYYVDNNDINKAVKCYSKAYQFERTLRTLFALLKCYQCLGYFNEFQIYTKEIPFLIPQTDEDYYYLGYIYHILDDKIKAQENYKKSNNYSVEYTIY